MIIIDMKKFSPIATFLFLTLIHVGYSIFLSLRVGAPVMMGLDFYLAREDHYLGLSYALAGAFLIYSLDLRDEGNERGQWGIGLGTALLIGLVLSQRYLLGCCGAPVYTFDIGPLGLSNAGVGKATVFWSMVVAVGAGYLLTKEKEMNSGPQGGSP